MRVKDVLNFFREQNIPPFIPWFLHENRNIVGSIHYWEYVCNIREEYLLGYAWGNIRGGSDYQLSTITDFRQIVELNNIPEDVEVKVKVPYPEDVEVKVKVPYLEYNQPLTNASYSKKLKLFKSAVNWKE